MRSLADVNINDYDFFDFGSGHGNSIRRCEGLFGGRGLGIDVDQKKIDAAQNRGVEVVYGDITTLPRRKLVTYVCSDLPHGVAKPAPLDRAPKLSGSTAEQTGKSTKWR